MSEPVFIESLTSETRSGEMIPAATLDIPVSPRRKLLDPHELAELAPSEAIRISIDLVDPNPDNPRHHAVEIDDLAASIHDYGLLQPVMVRRMGERYELLLGHRRWMAFLALAEQYPHDPQWREIPAVVRTADADQALLMLIAGQVHIQRWPPREEARLLETLAASRTLEEVGALLHKSSIYVSHRLKVYADTVLSALVQTGTLDVNVAEELRHVPDLALRRTMADQAVAEKWTPDQARRAVRATRTDAQLQNISTRARELLDLLSRVDPTRVPRSAADDLINLSRRIQLMARGGPTMPTVAEAEARAGVRPTTRPRKPAQRRRSGHKPKV